MTALVLAPRPLGATVEEQRARLPPPVECKDPIEPPAFEPPGRSLFRCGSNR